MNSETPLFPTRNAFFLSLHYWISHQGLSTDPLNEYLDIVHTPHTIARLLKTQNMSGRGVKESLPNQQLFDNLRIISDFHLRDLRESLVYENLTGGTIGDKTFSFQPRFESSLKPPLLCRVVGNLETYSFMQTVSTYDGSVGIITLGELYNPEEGLNLTWDPVSQFSHYTENDTSIALVTRRPYEGSNAYRRFYVDNGTSGKSVVKQSLLLSTNLGRLLPESDHLFNLHRN